MAVAQWLGRDPYPREIEYALRESPESIGITATFARERGLAVISDEAYEDVVFDGAEHGSPASLPGMYERTISLYTFSKTYAMTGWRVGWRADSSTRSTLRSPTTA